MKPKLVLTIILLALCQLTFACPDKDKKCEDGQCPYKSKPDLVQILGLEGEQAEKVQTLQEQFKEKRHTLKEEHHKEMKTLKEEQKTALANILSEEQLESLNAHWHSKKHHKHHHGDGHKQCPHKKSESH